MRPPKRPLTWLWIERRLVTKPCVPYSFLIGLDRLRKFLALANARARSASCAIFERMLRLLSILMAFPPSSSRLKEPKSLALTAKANWFVIRPTADLLEESFAATNILEMSPATALNPALRAEGLRPLPPPLARGGVNLAASWQASMACSRTASRMVICMPAANWRQASTNCCRDFGSMETLAGITGCRR